MSHNTFKNHRVPGIVLIIVLSLLLTACNEKSEKENIRDVTQTGLSSGEKADIQRLIAESRPGEPTPLDFSKEHHYRFYRGRLRQAGITRELFPRMFKVLEQARQQHLKSGPPDVYCPKVPSLKQTQNKTADTSAGTDYPVGPIQQITALGSDNGRDYQTSALSSVPNQPYESTLTLGLYTAAGDPIGPPQFVKQYAAGEDLEAETNGTLPEGQQEAVSIATYFWQDQSGTPYHGYIQAATSTAPTQIINEDPVIKVQGNTEIVVCLGRSGGNCDYNPEGGSGTNVLLPIKGSITYGDNIDPVEPDHSNVFSLITMARPDPGEGGGCTIKSTDDFFADPNTVIVENTLTWNLDPAHFEPAQGCLDPNAKAVYTFTVMVSIKGLPVYVSITNAPDTPPASPYFLEIPDMLIVFSCLPDGTRVLMADGTEKPIEKISPLEKVVSDSSNRTMTVHSSLRGKEEIPLVRIKSDKGHSLLLTDGHPVVTPGGVVLARHLEPGDVVLSRKGKVKITSVSGERFDGHVWNLVLDPNTKDEKRTEDNSTFYANGILVGDARMQFTWGRHFKHQPQDVMKRLPKEWHQDFLNYRKIEKQKKQ
jgi:hypothetical protein